MLPYAAKCTLCSEDDHRTWHCPTLHEPLKEGFYKPSGGYQGGGDDDDEKAKVKARIKQQANLKDKHAKAAL